MTADGIVALATTIAKMQRQQIVGTLKRKVESALLPHVPVSLDERYEPVIRPANVDITPILENTRLVRNNLTESDREYFRQQIRSLKRGTVTFLNRSVETKSDLPFSIHPLAGERRGFPRLWTIKLVSLEPASWLALYSADPDLFIAKTLITWLEAWKSSDITSVGSAGYLRRYWAPYAVSRRIGNLARFMAVLEKIPCIPKERVAKHLAKNLRFLSDHIEYGVGGNHLLENGTALIVGGVLLNDNDSVDRGLALLEEELSSQLLDDGMHFERSPMYHAILLYRITWALDILWRSGREIPPAIVSHVRSMCTCLRGLAPGDADYPLLNDSVWRECPSRTGCLSIANRVFEISGEGEDLLGGESGYYSVESGDMTVLVDGGAPCPEHLPGHAHNDIGNIVLWKNTEPVITDTGVYDYQPSYRRNYARSVAAHNTVQLDDVDQAVTYRRFMMGPRPKPQSQYTSSGSRRGVCVRYDSPKFIPSYTHKRLVEPINRGVCIEDRITTNGAPVTSRLHLVPGSEVTIETYNVRVTIPTGSTLELVIDGVESVTTVKTEYYPEYGRSVRRPTVEATTEAVTDEVCITHEIRSQENNG